MKDQYFTDEHDFFKWDFLEDVLDGCPDLQIFTNLTMLTPPDNSREGGRERFECGGRRRELYDFLRACRHGRRAVAEIRRYFEGKGIVYYGNELLYSCARREEYFSGVPNEALKTALIFLTRTSAYNGAACPTCGIKELTNTCLMTRYEELQAEARQTRYSSSTSTSKETGFARPVTLRSEHRGSNNSSTRIFQCICPTEKSRSSQQPATRNSAISFARLSLHTAISTHCNTELGGAAVQPKINSIGLSSDSR